MFMQACNRQSTYCVPLYDSLGENAVEFIINHSESSILFVARDKLSTVIQALPKAHEGLKTLVYWGTHDERHADADEVQSSPHARPRILPPAPSYLELCRGSHPSHACLSLLSCCYVKGRTSRPHLMHALCLLSPNLHALLRSSPA